MSGFVDFLESVLTYFVQISIILMEFAGVCVLVVNAVRAFYHWATRADRNLRLELAHGIALALEFKMGGEVLRTVVVREWSELLILGAIILLRGLLTFLIHWEIKNEQNAESIRSIDSAGQSAAAQSSESADAKITDGKM
ncbi:MAG: DUF1622 domain-containing protein [Lachnospiraceae bacterium]|nr:DUF1622 domain-containing protein [Lachnospiraceae bacterium]